MSQVYKPVCNNVHKDIPIQTYSKCKFSHLKLISYKKRHGHLLDLSCFSTGVDRPPLKGRLEFGRKGSPVYRTFRNVNELKTERDTRVKRRSTQGPRKKNTRGTVGKT